jgi:hypothetical protein
MVTLQAIYFGLTEAVTVFSKTDGVAYQFIPGFGAVFFVHSFNASYGARNADCPVAEGAEFWNNVAFFVEVHVATGGSGRAFAVIKGFRFSVFIPVNEKATTTNIAGPGIDYGHRELHGDCCVDSVSTVF